MAESHGPASHFGKDDDARAGLEQGLDLDFDLLADVRLAVGDDDHRAIRQIADALALVLAFADDFQLEDFAGQQDDLEAFGDFVEVDATDFLQRGDLGQVVVVGEQLGVEVAREADELGVHFLFLGKIAVVDADLDVGVVLDAVEHFKAAPAAGAFDGVGGIGDLLEFPQHEARDDDSPSSKCVSIRSAMRPSMMTLVSSSSRLSGLFCGENRT